MCGYSKTHARTLKGILVLVVVKHLRRWEEVPAVPVTPRLRAGTTRKSIAIHSYTIFGLRSAWVLSRKIGCGPRTILALQKISTGLNHNSALQPISGDITLEELRQAGEECCRIIHMSRTCFVLESSSFRIDWSPIQAISLMVSPVLSCRCGRGRG